MSANTKSKNFLRTGVIAAAGLASFLLAISPNNTKPLKSQEPGRLDYQQIQQASPINFQETIPNKSNPQFPDAVYPQDSSFPVNSNLEPGKVQQPKVDYFLGPDGTKHPYSANTRSILGSLPQSTQQPTPALPGNIPMPPAELPALPRPVYQPAPAKKQISRNYDSGQVHQLASKLSLPEFPWATACIGKVKNPNVFERIVGKKRVYAILDCQNAQFQHQAGLGFINEPHELRTLGEIVSSMYDPAFKDSKALERLGKHAGLDSGFIEKLEGTTEPTIYDRLAQFSFHYSASLANSSFPGVIYYQTSEGHTHATGNAKAIKCLKEKLR